MSSVVLEHQLRRNVLAYVDGIVVTSSIRGNYVADLAETFASLKKAGLSLNPSKCIFGVIASTAAAPETAFVNCPPFVEEKREHVNCNRRRATDPQCIRNVGR